MKYLFLFLLFGAALVAVADSLTVNDEDAASRISKCKNIKLYREILPTLEKFWKYLIQKYRCEEATSTKGKGLNCGIRRTEKSSIRLKIAGGKEVVKNSWPWQVSVFMSKDELTEDCDGTLIADDWVLTSASCIYQNANQTRSPLVRVGDHHIIKKDDHEQTIEISKIISHPKFKSSRFDNLNDIALLRLKRKVSLNDRVNVACLSGQRLSLAPGTKCTVLGWGLKNKTKTLTSLTQINLQLQELEVSLVSHQQCKSKLFFSDVKPSMHICAAAGGEDKGTRPGDIGVSLLCPKIDNGRKRWYLAGVFSFGTEGSGTKYEVFTRVSAYSDWIKRMQRMYAN